VSISFSFFLSFSLFLSLCYINLDENNNNLNDDDDDDDDVLMLSFSVTLVENNSYADFILHATDSISFFLLVVFLFFFSVAVL